MGRSIQLHHFCNRRLAGSVVLSGNPHPSRSFSGVFFIIRTLTESSFILCDAKFESEKATHRYTVGRPWASSRQRNCRIPFGQEEGGDAFLVARPKYVTGFAGQISGTNPCPAYFAGKNRLCVFCRYACSVAVQVNTPNRISDRLDVMAWVSHKPASTMST